eukprot:TRINITY_DN1266_c0_g3_i1.p1 TRINITY_DN1266_c0_g3~~TRINITY_DN1266_c0_g3_i1.p1  ORF type:complete len:311 (-),score=78.70 TRINITY_DN1266_c0_g3_i1:100-1032(-)
MQTTSVDLYEVLKVTSSASEEEIKSSYRSLVLLLHPDKNPGRDTTKEFQILMEAYSILKDPIKRREYDLQRMRSSNPVPINLNTPGSRVSVDPTLFNSLFEDPFFREHEQFFRSFFGHTSTFAPPTPQHFHPHPHAHPFPPHYNPRHSFHAGHTSNPFAQPPTFGQPPVFGQQPPTFGQQAPTFGQQQTPFGQQPPTFGQQAPAFGQQQSPFGQQPPAFGQQHPGMPGMQPVHPFAFHMEAMRRQEQVMQQFMGMSGFNPFGGFATPEEVHQVGSRRSRGLEPEMTMGMGMGSAPKRASTGFTAAFFDGK